MPPVLARVSALALVLSLPALRLALPAFLLLQLVPLDSILDFPAQLGQRIDSRVLHKRRHGAEGLVVMLARLVQGIRGHRGVTLPLVLSSLVPAALSCSDQHL